MGSAQSQVAAVLDAMKTATEDNIREVIAKLDQLSIYNRRQLFATTGNDSMLQVALREPDGFFLAYMLEQHANDPSLPLDVDLILRHTREHGNHHFLTWSTSPIWLAAFLKKVSVVALLLTHGADVNDTLIGYTPLHACLYRPSRSADTRRIAELLLDHGANLAYIESKCVFNKGVITPLMFAASNHPQLVAVILERLRAAGHDVSKYVQACNSRGRTALHYATGGNTNARLRHADVDVVTSLCKEGADLYARDIDGRDAFIACCYWLNVRSQSIHWTARHVWSRFSYWIGVFQPSLVRQWQDWELVGAQASLDRHVIDNDEQGEDEEELEVKSLNAEPEAPNDTDEVTFYEQALTIRQQLSPEDIPPIPVIPLFAGYVEPVTVEALRQLRDDRSLMLQHAVQVKRRHFGDNSTAVSAALDKYASHMKEVGFTQRAFECHMLALRSRPPMKDLLCIQAADEQQAPAYPVYLESHLHSTFSYLSQIYNSQRRLRESPVPDAVWDEALVVMQAAVDNTIEGSLIKNCCGRKKCIFQYVLVLVTRCLGPLNESRAADLQHVVNGLVVDKSDIESRSRHQKIFFQLFNDIIKSIGRRVDHNSSDAEDGAENEVGEHVDDEDSDAEHDHGHDHGHAHGHGDVSGEEFSCKHLTPDVVMFLARAARHGGVSLDPPRNSGPEALVAPLFVCAQLLAKPRRAITEKSKDDLRRVMELLVEEGGAHWDAADDTHNTAVCHFDSVTVSRYMNLQCLAARVISAHVTDYDLYLSPSLAKFVKLH